MKTPWKCSTLALGIVVGGLMPPLTPAANVWFYDGDPFVTSPASVLASVSVQDWTSAPGSPPGPVEVTAEHFETAVGLTTPVRLAAGVAPAQTRFILVNQVAPDIAVFNFAGVPPPMEDLDGNGLGDAWERQYFGQTGVDPNADPDGDGVSNRDEYLAGTSPIESNMLLIAMELLPPPALGQAALLRFELPRNLPEVRVEASGGLGGGWIPAAGAVREIGDRRVFEVSMDPSADVQFFRLRGP